MANLESRNAIFNPQPGKDEKCGETSGLAASGSCQGEEISPDLLKNTPNNIARLEDVIGHCEGRQKYLAKTRSPSDGGDVRWYFCKVPLAENELAASVPRTEIVGKGDYFRFGMRDSLAIEAAFLQREDELLSSWWKEYAECSEGPKGRPTSSPRLDQQPKSSASEDASSVQLFGVEEERVGVPVKGGLYELQTSKHWWVDLVKRHCFPVYWNGENRRVLRGHWFARKGGLDWLPLREDVAEQLDLAYSRQVWHRRTFQPSGLFAARVDLQGSTPGLHALFTGEDDTWEAWLNVDASGFSSVISLGGNGIKLRRGFSTSQSLKPTQDELRQQKEEEMDDYCSKVPVKHIVFMVHGIGQRLEKSNLVDDVSNFRHVTASLAERHLSPYQRDTQRVIFIPCQWRKGLKLSGESAVEKITLDGVRGLRVTLSATVHDVLYYMSPIYCQDIIDSVSNQLNRLYLKFLKRNPGYDGKVVSIYGHSLGSVLSYDILCHQENLSSPFPMEFMYKEHDGDEEFDPKMTNASIQCDSLINQEKSESRTIIGSANSEDKINKEGGVEVPSNIIEPSVISDLAEPSAQIKDLEAPNGPAPGISSVNCESDSPEEISLDESTCIENGGTDISLGNGPKEFTTDQNDNDKIITLLQKEINLLKARIAELESQCVARDTISGCAEGNMELHETIQNQPVYKTVSNGQEDKRNRYTPYIKYTKLEFKVDTFFAVGSPLGVFLALRNVRIGIGKGQEYWDEGHITEEMPACRQMFNIFHPFDPVAYRLEPLVCKEYVSLRPVIIPYHRGGKRLHVGFQEFTEDMAARSEAIMNHLSSVRVKVLTLCQSKRDGEEEDEKDAQEQNERTYGSIMMEKLTGSEEGRIDHVLQDKTFRHPYLSVLGAHTNYWRDNDTALFILKHLYWDIPEEPNSSDGSNEESSKSGSGSHRWADKSEAAEEDLPLTFYDRVTTRNFSRKAKKIMKKRSA
ncbi:DDHD domain [Dillenia turbinata]|uniref:DDHD domain n=1 Tax=Dillenia turbinata TaxID=194707 RepID=A0AAN8ZUI4_9MAGN